MPPPFSPASAGSDGHCLLATRWAAARKSLQDWFPCSRVTCTLTPVANWNRTRRHLPAKGLLEGSYFLFLFTKRLSLWKPSKAGQTWAVAIVALLLGADKCCLDEDVILSLAACGVACTVYIGWRVSAERGMLAGWWGRRAPSGTRRGGRPALCGSELT